MLSGNSGNPLHSLLTVMSGDGSLGGKKPSGQTVITSGDGGVFPPGIPVGVIEREAPRQGQARAFLVRPYAAISQLDSVTVIRKMPDAWASKTESENLEEFLRTEFGAPDYPETLIRLDDRRNRPQTQTDRPAEDEKAPEVQQPATRPTEPRRLQNVEPPR